MKNITTNKLVTFFVLISLFAPLFSNAAIIIPIINLTTIVNTQGQDASFHFNLNSCSGVFCNDLQQFDLQTQNLSGSNSTSFFPSGDRYILTQSNVSGLKIDTISCTSNDSRVTFTYGTNSVSFSSVAWSSVTCTFNNVKENTPPTIENLSQYQESSANPIAAGETFIGNSVALKADVSDADSAFVNLEIELKPVGVLFDGSDIYTATATAPIDSATLQVIVSNLIPPAEQNLPFGNQKSFHWRARAVDADGAVSEWKEFSIFTPASFTAKYTLGLAASELAKQLVNQNYLWGGKGWDFHASQFVDPNTIKSGYSYWDGSKENGDGNKGAVAFGQGVDCSGLVMWSYDRSFDSTKSHCQNFIKYESADGQYRHNTQSIAESQLQPGDLMFFDWNNDGYIDHVAEYVGENGNFDIVQARNKQFGITTSTVNTLKEQGFIDFVRPKNAVIAMQITGHSPIDLTVTDPDGNTITPNTVIPSDEEYLREIPGELYYSEMEKGSDGNPMDIVYSPVLKQGTYKIFVAPIAGSASNQTYSLDFTAGDTTIEIAKDVPLSQIPNNGYGVVVGSDNIPTLKVDDTTPPEASIAFDPSAKKINIAGTDNLPGATVATTDKSATISDASGNTLTLSISKNITQPKYAALVIPSFSYSNNTTTNDTTSLRYFWATNPKTNNYALLISAIRTPTERLISIYIPLLNKTYIVESNPTDDNTDLSTKSALLLLRKKVKTFTGMVVPHISTNQGKVNIEY